MRVVKKKAVTKIEAPVTRKVKVEKGEAPVIAPRTAMKAKAPAAATPRAMKVETPVGKRHRATKDMSAALSGSKKRGQSSSAEPLADAGSFPACNVAAVDDAYSCLAQLQKALAVPIAEPVGTAAPQLLTATLSEKTSFQWQPNTRPCCGAWRSGGWWQLQIMDMWLSSASSTSPSMRRRRACSCTPH